MGTRRGSQDISTEFEVRFLAVMFGGLHRGISKRNCIDVLKNDAISTAVTYRGGRWGGGGSCVSIDPANGVKYYENKNENNG